MHAFRRPTCTCTGGYLVFIMRVCSSLPRTAEQTQPVMFTWTDQFVIRQSGWTPGRPTPSSNMGHNTKSFKQTNPILPWDIMSIEYESIFPPFPSLQDDWNQLTCTGKPFAKDVTGACIQGSTLMLNLKCLIFSTVSSLYI